MWGSFVGKLDRPKNRIIIIVTRSIRLIRRTVFNVLLVKLKLGVLWLRRQKIGLGIMDFVIKV